MKYRIEIENKKYPTYGQILLETNLYSIAKTCLIHLQIYYYPDKLLIYDIEEHDYVDVNIPRLEDE